MIQTRSYWTIGAVALLVAVLIAAMLVVIKLPDQPPRATTARIISEADNSTRLVPSAVIVARASNGVIGRAVVQGAMQRCKVGDEIKAQQIGIALELDVRRCGGVLPLEGALQPTQR